MSGSSRVLRVDGRGVPVRGNDIDTDRIIPARYLRCVTFDGLGEHAFEDDRKQLAEQGRTHPFDDPRFKGAGILVVNRNFGCGSSREHAPQALVKWGIRAIVGVSFAEIFFGNNVAMGIPCVTAAADDVDRIQTAIEEDPHADLVVDIEHRQVHCGEEIYDAHLPDGPREQFLSGGWDATAHLLEGLAEVRVRMQDLPYLNGFR